jgi:hypothetical protein
VTASLVLACGSDIDVMPPQPACHLISATPPDADGWVVVTAEPGCFPPPGDEEELVVGVVTNISTDVVLSRTCAVEPDGSWSCSIEAAAGDELTVQTQTSPRERSYPCYLVAPGP